MTDATPKRDTSTGRGLSAKGEQTRTRILDAVLRVIAREGTRGVTHRSVAAEADVQLSLTTYYFSDIDELIRESFSYFSRRSRPDLEAFWDSVFEYLDSFSAAELRLARVREKICEQLARRGTDYLVSQIINKPVGLAVEQVLFTHTRLSPELREMGEAHRELLFRPLVDLCARFNRKDPEVEAKLLLNSITTLEYQALATPEDAIDRAELHSLLRRHIGWVLGLKRA